MRTIVDFVKTCVVGGFFGLLPVLLVAFVLAEVVDILASIAAPIADALPIAELGGVEMARIVALVLILLACFLAGLLLRTRVGAWATELVEGTILNRLPGYSMLKTISLRFGGIEEGSLFAPGLADLYGGDARTLVFIVEEHADGRIMVLVPNAPTPTVGTLHVLPATAITRLGASPAAFANSIMQWGVGSKDLLDVPG
jgi:uncharacterized membrane protein